MRTVLKVVVKYYPDNSCKVSKNAEYDLLFDSLKVKRFR